MTTRVKSSSSRSSRQKSAVGGDPGADPSSYSVRFDYSDIYLNNEDLNNQLEDQSFELYKQKYRMAAETESQLKRAKQDADEMLQLKNKVKNRDPNESSETVLRSADTKRRGSTRPTSSKVSSATQKTHFTQEPSDENGDTFSGDKDNDNPAPSSEQQTENESGPANNERGQSTSSKPMQNLTMFLLSINNFKRGANLQRKSEKEESLDTKQKRDTAKKKSSSKVPEYSSVSIVRRPSSYHHPSRDRTNNGENGTGSKDSKSEYGIHVKKDFSRSLRALRQISKLEQDSKYGFVDKYEERRKKLLAECRDTGDIQKKIKVFLKDVDEFKKMTDKTNSIERVLMRTKSANQQRSTWAW